MNKKIFVVITVLLFFGVLINIFSLNLNDNEQESYPTISDVSKQCSKRDQILSMLKEDVVATSANLPVFINNGNVFVKKEMLNQSNVLIFTITSDKASNTLAYICVVNILDMKVMADQYFRQGSLPKDNIRLMDINGDNQDDFLVQYGTNYDINQIYSAWIYKDNSLEYVENFERYPDPKFDKEINRLVSSFISGPAKSGEVYREGVWDGDKIILFLEITKMLSPAPVFEDNIEYIYTVKKGNETVETFKGDGSINVSELAKDYY
ncbi:MAG: hypothetical protein KatS3mg085_041 [Candidatus Dojkabacteria bacterium]|nr:MAG: hypothetical protein KatS3mg085_041 [Candidatus Dojkabacteria bacterium]